MSLQRFVSIWALAVLVCAFAWTGAAQENKELATSQAPFILEPPTTSLDTSGAVNLPPANTSGVTSPSNEQSKRQARVQTSDDTAKKQATPERQTPKNVMRIDDKTRRKVKPVAIIKASLSPWGYTRRFQEGDIARPEHPYGAGTGSGLGASTGPNAPRSLSLSGIGSRRSSSGSSQRSERRQHGRPR